MSPARFKDHFSGHADAYARHRPDYPRALFETLAKLAPARSLAWDCGTGNGQAAVGLAEFFQHVAATDASAEQIAQARTHPRVEYAATPAHLPNLAPRSVDLVTVAQALHWFDLDAFYAAVRRVLKPRGVIAVWCYGLLAVDPHVDAVIGHLYRDVLGTYWPPERAWVDNGYRELIFPFQETAPPAFHMQAHWTLQGLLDYLGTWSAVRRYRAAHGVDPLVQVGAELRAAWDAPDAVKTVVWPLTVRVGIYI